MNEKLIVICVPTFRREKLLQDCLLSIASLDFPVGWAVETIVVDNDINESARKICESLSGTLPVTLHYFVHAQRGLAEVRNRLLDEALAVNATLIAFIDDDEQVDKQWLCQHLENMSNYEADVSSGPVRQLGEVSQKEKEKPSGSTPRYVSTNNVLFKSSLASTQKLRFDSFYNFIGGEDFDFFERSEKLGNTHVWAEQALVLETVTQERDSFTYLFYRHFSGGINNVLRFRRSHSWWQAWLKYLPRSAGKIIGFCVYLLSAAIRANKKLMLTAVKKLASGLGYLAGLLNVVVERYREPDEKNDSNALSYCPAMKTLIIKLGALGDAIVATPAIRAILETHSQSPVYLLTSTEYAGLFAALDGVEVAHFPRRGIVNAIECIKWIRKQNFDRIYDLQSNDRSRLYCCLSGAREIVGNHALFPYTHHPGDTFSGQSHVSVRHEQALRSVGIEINHRQAWLPVSREARQRVATWLSENAPAKTAKVLIHAGASRAHPQKRWPYFAEIAEKLCSHGFDVIWLGGSDDAELNTQLAGEVGINATDVFSLSEIVALGQSARFALTNDSGPMHVLSCAGVPVYALFGPTDWRRYHALGQIDRVISLDKPQTFWGEKNNVDINRKDLSLLSPEMVWAVLSKLENITL